MICVAGEKADLLAYRKVTNTVPTSDRWGGIQKAKPPKVKQDNIVERTHKNNTDVLSLESEAWHDIDKVNNDTLLEHGGLITGMAGTGKQYSFEDVESQTDWTMKRTRSPTTCSLRPILTKHVKSQAVTQYIHDSVFILLITRLIIHS